MDESKLSPEARRLIELAQYDRFREPEIDLQTVLSEHPELIAGLNEYMVWYADHCRAVAKQEQQKPVAHGTSEAVRQIKLPPPKK
jgi:hypothetical protein